MSENINGKGNRKLTWGLHEASDATGLSVSYLRKLLRNGVLKKIQVGGRVLIDDADLRDLLSRQKTEHVVTPLSDGEKAQRRAARVANKLGSAMQEGLTTCRQG